MEEGSYNKEKKKYWTEQEVIHMLYLIEEKHILTLLDGKRYRNSDIFTELAKAMLEGGYSRTPDQLRSKWKSLKREYQEAKRKNSNSGSDRSEFAFYAEMASLLDSRPSSMMVNTGVDSTPSEEEPVMSPKGEVEQPVIEMEEPVGEGSGGSETFTVTTEDTSFTVSATAGPAKRRKTHNGKSGYTIALAAFAKDVRANQLEVQKEQQKWLSEEFERDRQWEKQLLESIQAKHAEDTKQLVNTFLSGLQCIYGRNSHPPFMQFQNFLPQTNVFRHQVPSPDASPSTSSNSSFPSPCSTPNPTSFPSPSTSNFNAKKF